MLQLDDYVLEKFLGKGTFGEVYLTKKRNSNFLYATKRMDKALVEDVRYKKYFVNEISILKKLFHKNIIRIQEFKMTTNHYYIIMEYCNGGSLTQCLKKYKEIYHQPFTEEIVQYLMRQIISAVKFIHSQGIVHRDLKLDNILVNFNNENDKNNMNLLNAQVKIIDFGFASAKEDSKMFTTAIGSPLNMDPLILQKFCNGRAQTNDLQYDEKADIWSLGALCYQMLIGDSPFDAYNMQELVQKIENGTYSVPTNLSKEVVSFLNGMLQYDPNKRLTAENLSNHAFLTKNISDFSHINTNLIAKNIYGGQLNINIKNNQSIWAIFNEDSQEELNNIPGDFYTQDTPLAESVYINTPGKPPGITKDPFDEDQDFLSTNFISTDSVPITSNENILKSGSTPIPPYNSGLNMVQNIQKNTSGAQFQYSQNKVQYIPEVQKMINPQRNPQEALISQNQQLQVNNMQYQRQNQNMQNYPYRRPPSDNNIIAGKNIPSIENPELIRRQYTNPPSIQTPVKNNQINNNNLRNINQGINNLNQAQNGLKIMPRMQLTNNQMQQQNNLMRLPNNQIQQQNNLLPSNNPMQRPNNQQLAINQIQQQNNLIPPNNQIQRPNNPQLSINQMQQRNNLMRIANNQIPQQNVQIQRPNNQQLAINQIQRPNNQQLPINQMQRTNNPKLAINQMQRQNNLIQQQNNLMQLPNNQNQQQSRQIIYPNNQPNIQYNEATQKQNRLMAQMSNQQNRNINNNIEQRPLQKIIYSQQTNGQINQNINQNLKNPNPQQIQRVLINNYNNQTTPHKQLPSNLNIKQNPNSSGKIKVIKQTKYIVINETPNKNALNQNNINQMIQKGQIKRVASDRNILKLHNNLPATPQKLLRNASHQEGLIKTNLTAPKNVINNPPVKRLLINRNPMQLKGFPQQQVLTQPNQNGNRFVPQF